MNKMDLQSTLKDWGFEELAPEFIENGIDVEVLKICNIEDISSLLSPLNLGSRIKFKRKLDDFQKGAIWVEICSEVPTNVQSEVIPTHSSEVLPSCSSTSVSIPEVSEVVPVANESNSPEKLQKLPRKYSPKKVLKDHSETAQSPRKRVRKLLNYDDINSEVLDKNLKDNVFGRSINSFYEKTGFLDRRNRNKLARLIISIELEANLDKIISSERFLQLREAIVRIFPSESHTHNLT